MTPPINRNIISKIKCFYNKRSNTYLLVFGKIGLIFKNKGDDSTFIVSTEKKFLKKKSMKAIKYDDAIMEITKTLLNFTQNKSVISINSDGIDLFYNIVNSILEKNKELTEWDSKDPFEPQSPPAVTVSHSQQ